MKGFFLFCSLIWVSILQSEQLAISVKAQSAILINAETKGILFEKNAYQKQFPASITKVAAAAYALELRPNHLDTVISAEQECIASISEELKRKNNFTHPSHWIELGSSHIGIKRGEELTFRDLLHGMLLATANDASNVIAQFSGGSIPKFIEGLNNYIQRIGCKDTFFCNPHGLHHPKHQTTAYDMALITIEAMKNTTFCDIVKTVRYTRPKTNKQEASLLVQTNRLLRSGPFHYPKAIGVKTGKTTIANNTFVAAARDGDRTLIAVLLNVKERDDIYKDAIKLFDAAFNQPKMERVLVKTGKQKYTLQLEGAEGPIKTYTKENAILTYYPAEEPKIKACLKWHVGALPVKKGEKVGELVLAENETKIYKVVPLYAESAVKARLLFKIKQFFLGKKESLLIFICVGIVFLLGVVFAAIKRLRRSF